MLWISSEVAFISPVAYLLHNQTPSDMSDALSSVGLSDLSGQHLSTIRSDNLEHIISRNFGGIGIGEVFINDDQLIARIRNDIALFVGSSNSGFGARTGTEFTTTDITHGRGHFLLMGNHARDLLAKVCAISFADSAFPDNHVVQTSLAKTHATIIRHDQQNTPAYHLIVGFSLAAYVWDVVFDAMREFNGVYVK